MLTVIKKLHVSEVTAAMCTETKQVVGVVFHTYWRTQRPPQTVKGIEPCASVLALVCIGGY